jgi:hypothetical protein
LHRGWPVGPGGGTAADDLACDRRAAGEAGALGRADHAREVRTPDGVGKLGSCKAFLLEVVSQDPDITLREFICKCWTSEPERFTLNPIHQMPGLSS